MAEASSLARVLSVYLIDYFLPLWAGVLCLAIAWALTRPPSTAATATSSRSRHFGAHEFPGIALFFAFLAGYISLILLHADFADFDHYILTVPIVTGRDGLLPIWPTQGRFFPLGHTEFSILRRILPTPQFYHAFAVSELLLLVAILFSVLRDFHVGARCLVLTLCLISFPVFAAFYGLIYPERNLLLLLAVLLWAAQRFPERGDKWVLAAGLVATQLALYYKETTVLLVLGFAGGRLLIAWRAAPSGGRSLGRYLRSHPLETGMIALAGVFILFYVGIMMGYGSTSYVSRHPGHVGPLDAFTFYLRADPLLAIMLVVFLFRVARILRRQATPDLFWDPLALAGLAYLSGYVTLGLWSTYYMSPVDLIAALYLAERARLAVASEKLRPWIAVAAAGLIAVPLATVSGLAYVHARNSVHGKAQIAAFLHRLADSSAAPVRLWFPRAVPYRLSVFGDFLQYKGIRVVSDSGSPPGARVIFEGADEFPTGRCLSYGKIPCRHAKEPRPEALVVILPDDELPEDAPGTLRPAGPLLYQYEPFAADPAPLHWTMRVAGIFSPRARGTTARADALWGYVSAAPGRETTSQVR